MRYRNRRAAEIAAVGAKRAQVMREGASCLHVVRNLRGTRGAGPTHMATREDDWSWTIPLHVLMWTTIVAGIVMALAVYLMH